MALIAAIGKRKWKEIKWPWFILFFIAATVIYTYFSSPVRMGVNVFSIASSTSRTGLILTLYLIGSNISRATLRNVGVRPLLHGTLLWLIVTAISLALIYKRIIAL